ncbi:BglG family transcription antiterminator [Thermovenabulum sp.]|uniref:BglG family transcription antiterminator n=1 Tax=Thermovenabulum sp. TaxID=3100335 RepID=UPI003C7A2A59
MNERCAQILTKIILSEKPVKIDELAKNFNVSPRTIRYDLDKIDEFLKENELPTLIRKPGEGVLFDCSNEIKRKIISLLNNENMKKDYKFYFSPKEREKIILCELFSTKNYITIDYLSNLLKVSRGTIINDLQRISKWLNSQKLTLKTSPRYGIKIHGDEANLRRAVIKLLSENVEIDKALDFIKLPIYRRLNTTIEEQIKKLFEDMDIGLIEKAVKIAEEQLNTIFSDEAYSGLVIHLAIAVKRIQLGKDIIMPEGEIEKLKLTKEFVVASCIAKNLEQSFDIKIPSAEIGYITIHLLGGKVTATDTFNKEDWHKLQLVTVKIIQDIQQILGVDFLSDEELYKGLMEHLGPTIYRLKHGLPLKNPILNEVKNSYPDVFNAVKNGLFELEKFTGCKIPDEEVGYIAVHIGAALERLKANIRKIYKVIIVCGTGVGTAKLLSSKIKAEFDNIEIIGTFAYHQLKDINFGGNIDLVISTVPIEEFEVPIVVVNPLLPEDDILKINKILKDRDKEKKDDYIINQKRCKLSVNEMIDIIEKHCIIISKQQLIEELSNYLNKPQFQITKEVYRPVLEELITEKTIKLNIDAKDWEDAVRKGGEILVENGFVEPRYVEAMIKTVKEIGPYIVIAPGIALPHARPEDGVREICMSLITLKEPVNFGSEANDPVKLVISFGAVDHHSHLKALSKLMNLFNNNNYIKTILATNDKKEILNIIRQCSNMEV